MKEKPNMFRVRYLCGYERICTLTVRAPRRADEERVRSNPQVSCPWRGKLGEDERGDGCPSRRQNAAISGTFSSVEDKSRYVTQRSHIKVALPTDDPNKKNQKAKSEGMKEGSYEDRKEERRSNFPGRVSEEKRGSYERSSAGTGCLWGFGCKLLGGRGLGREGWELFLGIGGGSESQISEGIQKLGLRMCLIGKGLRPSTFVLFCRLVSILIHMCLEIRKVLRFSQLSPGVKRRGSEGNLRGYSSMGMKMEVEEKKRKVEGALKFHVNGRFVTNGINLKICWGYNDPLLHFVGYVTVFTGLTGFDCQPSPEPALVEKFTKRGNK